MLLSHTQIPMYSWIVYKSSSKEGLYHFNMCTCPLDTVRRNIWAEVERGDTRYTVLISVLVEGCTGGVIGSQMHPVLSGASLVIWCIKLPFSSLRVELLVEIIDIIVIRADII